MPRLAYLLTASHSGSTLLAMMLGAQPGACTGGELKATHMGDASLYRCSCGSRIRECAFWRQVAGKMNVRGFHGFDITMAGTDFLAARGSNARRLLAPLHRGRMLETARDLALSCSSEWKDHLAECGARNLALIESLLEITGADVVVDSSKLALRLKYLLRIPRLEVKVIRMIRDGRAVALTYTDEWNFADSADPAFRGGGNGARRPPPRGSIAEAARDWRRGNESCDAILSGLPDSQWTEVRYEELCADPAACLKRLAAFLALNPARIELDFRKRPQHVIGNGMRMDSSSEIRLDERWRSILGEDDLREFDQFAGNLNRRYGYG